MPGVPPPAVVCVAERARRGFKEAEEKNPTNARGMALRKLWRWIYTRREKGEGCREVVTGEIRGEQGPPN